MRIDTFLSQKYGFSRNKIQQFILAELILKNNKIVKKSSEKIVETDEIIILEDRRTHWVSRSAEKLFWFLENFPDLKAKIFDSVCLDVGSSTGGFTQVLIEFGAKSVDAVDVWTSQLAEILRQNPKIFSYEQTDIRDFSSKNSPYDCIVCDASFVSLTKIVDVIFAFANEKTEIILLFKPQFEVEKNFLNKNWVPKDFKKVEEAMKNFENKIFDLDAKIMQKQKSSLLGEAGNQEWIYWLRKK